ncbi:DUF3231 family protein [Bacillus sp. JJ1764]|uniref:DUF3231 family protein n=1 Tax=Bacillus sp. JJ1764 TaxID=3122964 RepID=UPI002FFED268
MKSMHDPLTSAEMGKLWATYVGNSMTKQIIRYFLQHVEDEDINRLLENSLTLTNDFMDRITTIFVQENFPIPAGFTDEDVNLNVPRLFEDEFYVHYLQYALKAGISIYSLALPLVFRNDVKDLAHYCLKLSTELLEEVKHILITKKLILRPPVIPIPNKVKYVKKNFLNGFFGQVRPLHALEIAHLYDNIESNVTSKALILGFSQVAKADKIRELFRKGADITTKAIEQYQHQLQSENLPSPTLLDHLVTDTTLSPFSDKIMLFHKIDMFSMKIRALGNSLAVNGRHDIGFMYVRSFMSISKFVEDATEIMIENGWMEQPPVADDTEFL